MSIKQSSIVSTTDEKGLISATDYRSHGQYTNPQGIGLTTTYTPTLGGAVQAIQIARLYQISPLINSMIGIGSDYISTLPFKVVDIDRTGGKTPRFTGEPFTVLNWINSKMTVSTFLKTCYSWYKLLGTCFVYVERTEKEFSDYSLMSLYPMNPMHVFLVPDIDGVDVYFYRPPGIATAIPIDPRNIIPMKAFNPMDAYIGNMDLATLAYDVDIERFAKKQLASYYSHASKFSGVVLSKDEVGPDELKRLRIQINTKFAGADNAYRTLVLEKGMEYKALPTNDSSQYLPDLLESNAISHSMVLGIPIGMLSGNAGTAKLIELEAMMWKKTLVPWAFQFSDILTKGLALPINLEYNKRRFGLRTAIEFDYDVIEALNMHELEQTKVDTASVLVGNMTSNEVRRRRGRTPYSGDFEEFGDMPRPLFNAKYGISKGGATGGASANNETPGVLGGRDQSSTGETQMIDQTGTKALPDGFDLSGIIDKIVANYVGD